jgi:gluconate kinase
VIPRWFLAPLRDVLQAAGHEVAYVVLRAPLEVCAARVQEREGVPSVEPDVIEQIWSQFADLGEHEGNAIDVGALSPAEAADTIAAPLSTRSSLI